MSFFKPLVTQIMHHQLSKLDELYQKNAGQECYIFGDGVSLKWMDLQQFADRESILGNMSIYHNQVEELKVPYCAIIEPYYFYPYFPYFGASKFKLIKNYLHREYRKSILQNPETLFFLNISNYPAARFSNTLFVSRLYKSPFEVNNPFRDRADSHDGTFRFQISLAIYLGYKKAYLVGHDYTHSRARLLHFYEKGEGILNGAKDFNSEFINYAKQYIDLVTVVLEGGSNTMNSITYTELTGRQPSFRENVEIVSKAKLESLATWQGYSVF